MRHEVGCALVRRHLAIPAVLAAALLAGCAGQPVADNADDFEGEERAVAEVIDDLSSAGSDRDAAGICATILTEEVSAALKQGSSDCEDVLEDQLSDASDFELDVKSISIDGDTATAEVEGPVNGEEVVQTLTFERQGEQWRLAALEIPQG